MSYFRVDIYESCFKWINRVSNTFQCFNLFYKQYTLISSRKRVLSNSWSNVVSG